MEEVNSSDNTELLRARFWRLARLNILSNLTVPLVGLVDTAMLGHLPDIRFLAGVALATILFDYLYWTLGFLRMSTTGLAAQAGGRGDSQEIVAVLYRGAVLGLAGGLLILLVQSPIRDLGFYLLSGDPAVEEAGRAYFNARIWGAPAMLLNLVLVGWLLGRQKSQQVLWMTVFANLCNIALNGVFILGLGWAAWGAGLASMLSQYLMLVWGLAILRREKEVGLPYWPSVLQREQLGSLLRLNGDLVIRTFCLISAFAVFTNIGSLMGTTVLAANVLLLRLLGLAAHVIDGVAHSTETLAGHLGGAARAGRLRELLRLSLRSSFGVGLLFALAFVSFPKAILGLLAGHPEVTELAGGYVYWLVVTLLLGSIAYSYDGFFLGLTWGAELRRAMLLSTLVGFVPLAVLAWWWNSNTVLWTSLTVLMLTRAGTLALKAERLLTGLDQRGRRQ